MEGGGGTADYYHHAYHSGGGSNANANAEGGSSNNAAAEVILPDPVKGELVAMLQCILPYYFLLPSLCHLVFSYGIVLLLGYHSTLVPTPITPYNIDTTHTHTHTTSCYIQFHDIQL